LYYIAVLDTVQERTNPLGKTVDTSIVTLVTTIITTFVLTILRSALIHRIANYFPVLIYKHTFGVSLLVITRDQTQTY